MSMGECSAYSSLPLDSNVKLVACSMSWWPSGTDDFGPEEPQ